MPYFADRPKPVELKQSIPLSTATQRELKSLARACKKSVGASAWHEAAHAVVGVRLGLTLQSIDIRVRVVHDHEGNAAVSSGYTSYRADDLAERFGVVGAHRACAIFAAAGIAAEEDRLTGDLAAASDDFNGIVRFAKLIGIPTHDRSDPILKSFVSDVTDVARRLLSVDKGVAWTHVRTALVAQKTLTPEKVVALMARAGGA